jgi:hypothetical protein
MNFKYESERFEANLNLVSILDFIILGAMQWKNSMCVTEIEGTFRPKKFTTWEEYAYETRKLMANVFDMKMVDGNIKDKQAMEKKVSPMKYYY